MPKEVEINGAKAVFGTPEEALWTEILDSAKKELKSMEDAYFRVTTFQNAIIKLAEAELSKWRELPGVEEELKESEA